MQLHEALARAMFQYKLSQKDLAENSGVPRTRINEFVNGHRGMSSKNLDKIYQALPQEVANYMFSLISNTEVG